MTTAPPPNRPAVAARPGSAGPAGQRTVKEHNLGLVLGLVAAASATAPGTGGRGVSRAQMASSSGLTRATVGTLVDELLAAGLVVEMAPERGGRGRPSSPLQLNANGLAGFGVEVNVDYVSACAVDLTGQVRARRVHAIDNRARQPRAALRSAARVADRVAADARHAGLVPAGLSLALPGLVDTGGILRSAPNLPSWHDVQAATMLAELLGDWAAELGVMVDNEANLAALAQLWFGGVAGLRDFVHVSGEIGVGAGIVLDGRLFRGVLGYAGELGHVVVDPRGPPCHCGSNGCLEQVAGQEALLRNAGLDPATGIPALVELATAGDRAALDSIARAGEAIGVALAAAANLLDCSAIVLGGVYAQLGGWLVEPITAQLARRVVSRRWSTPGAQPPSVLVSALGSDAAVRGAAGWVVQDVLTHNGRPRTRSATGQPG